MEELKIEAKNSTTKANLLEDENRRMEEENIALNKLKTGHEGGDQEDRGREVGREEVEQRHEGGDLYEEGGDEVDKS